MDWNEKARTWSSFGRYYESRFGAVYNAANGPGNFNGTLGTVDDNGTPWIPATSLSQTDGEAIAACRRGTRPRSTGLAEPRRPGARWRRIGAPTS